jgi:hypothetical protein
MAHSLTGENYYLLLKQQADTNIQQSYFISRVAGS